MDGGPGGLPHGGGYPPGFPGYGPPLPGMQEAMFHAHQQAAYWHAFSPLLGNASGVPACSYGAAGSSALPMPFASAAAFQYGAPSAGLHSDKQMDASFQTQGQASTAYDSAASSASLVSCHAPCESVEANAGAPPTGTYAPFSGNSFPEKAAPQRASVAEPLSTTSSSSSSSAASAPASSSTRHTTPATPATPPPLSRSSLSSTENPAVGKTSAAASGRSSSGGAGQSSRSPNSRPVDSNAAVPEKLTCAASSPSSPSNAHAAAASRLAPLPYTPEPPSQVDLPDTGVSSGTALSLSCAASPESQEGTPAAKMHAEKAKGPGGLRRVRVPQLRFRKKAANDAFFLKTFSKVSGKRGEPLVWCKRRGRPWWPGLLANPDDPHLVPPLPERVRAKQPSSDKDGEIRLLFLCCGTWRYWWASSKGVRDFREGYADLAPRVRGLGFLPRLAVQHALEECGWRDNVDWCPSKTIVAAAQAEEVEDEDGEGWLTENACSSDSEEEDDGFMDNDWWEGRKIPTAAGNPSEPEEASKAFVERAASSRRSARAEETHPDARERQATPQTEGPQEGTGKASPSSLTSASLQVIASEAPPGLPDAEAAWTGEGERPEGRRGVKKKDSGREFFPGEEMLFERDRKKARETESGQKPDKNVSGPVRDPEACRSIRLGAARGLVLAPASSPATEEAGPKTSSSLTRSAFVKGSQNVSSRHVETSSVRSSASRFDESHVESNARLHSPRRPAHASHPPFVSEDECESKKMSPMCVDSPEREMFLGQTAEVAELSKAGSVSAFVLDASGSSAEPSPPSLSYPGDLANSEVSSVTPCPADLPRPSSSPFSMSFSGRSKGTSQSRAGPAVEPPKLPDPPTAAVAVGDSPAPTSAGAASGAVSGPLGRAEGGASDETGAKKNASGVSLGASTATAERSADASSASVTPAAQAPQSWPETIWHRLRRQAEAAKKERPQSPALPRSFAASTPVGQARPAESAQETPAIPTYGAVIAFGQEKPAGLKETLHPPHIRAAAAAGAAAAAMAAAAAASAAAEKTQRQEALSLQASQALPETAVGAKTAARLETAVGSGTGVGSGPENRIPEEVAKAAAAAAVAAAAQVTVGVLGHGKKGDEKKKVPGGGHRGRESETLPKGGRSPRESEDSEAGKRRRASRRRGSSSSWDEDSRAEGSCRRGRGSSRSVSVSSPFLLSQRHRSRPRRDCTLGSRRALKHSRGRRRGSSGSSSVHSVSRASSSLSSAPSRLKWRRRRERPRRSPSRSRSTSSRGDRRRHRERHVGSPEKRGYLKRWSSRESSCRSTDGVRRGGDGKKKEGRRGNRRRENKRREDREEGGSSRCSASSGCSAKFRDGSSGSWRRVDRGRGWHSPWRERGDRRDDWGHKSARFSRSSSSASAGLKLAAGRREADSPDSSRHEEGPLASGRRWARRGRTRRDEASRKRCSDGREGMNSSLERSPDPLSPSSRRALGRPDERKETVAMGPTLNSETATTPPPTQSLSPPVPSVCSASAPLHGEGPSSFLPASGSCTSNEASVCVTAALPERDAKTFQATSAPSSGTPLSSSFSPCVSAAAVSSLNAAPQSGPGVWPESALEAAGGVETREAERRPLSSLSETGLPSSPAPISALPRPPCHLFVSASTASPSQSSSAAPNSSARDASAPRDGRPPGLSVSEGGDARSKHRFSRGFPSSKSVSASPLSRSSRSPSYLSSSSPSRERWTRGRSHASKHRRRRLRSRCSRRSRSPSGSPLCEQSRDRESMGSQTPERRSRGREARERRGTFPRRGYRRGSSSEFSGSSRRSPSRSQRESESSYLSFAARRVRMLHAQGRCLPCRFHWRRGCRNGDGCKFCHDSSHDRFMLGREPERGSSRSASMGGSRENGGPEGGLSVSLENRVEAGEGPWGFLGEDGVRGRGLRRFRRSSFGFSRPFLPRGDGAFREETRPCQAWREKRPRAIGNSLEREGGRSAETDVKRGSCVERDERWMEGDQCSLESNPEEGNRVERAPKRSKETDEGSGHQTEEPGQAIPAGEKALDLTVTEGGEKNEGGEEGGRASVDDQQTPGGIGLGDNVDIFHVPCPLEEMTFGGSWNSADAPAGVQAEVGGLKGASEAGTDGQKVHA
ncbi:hypothetical protein TGP89_225890 [Toxoplasma gondii p89]|uniref:PWWP domain-containing protein n=1 Tax=Toxoplasma gondii p89 TaxID=943119 RepID=A0A086KEH7_TOXGO|nr:hypothetical protein TGP89_225890 [Toxoplasma gondii p89]